MLNAPEVPEPNESETDQLVNRLADVRGDTLQLGARLDHLEHELQRIEGKLDELWREHTKLINNLQ